MTQPRWRRYLRFWRRDLAADVDDELSFHLAQRVEQYEAAGMSHDEAVSAAGAQLGDEEAVRALLIGIDRRVARTHDVTLWLDALRSDLRTSVRSLVRQPTFSAAVVVTLALGLGVNAAMFSFLDRVFLRTPAGVVSPTELRRLWSFEHDRKGELVARQLGIGVEEQRALAATFGNEVAFAIYARQPRIRIGNGGDAPATTVMRAAANYLPLLGVHAAFGRLFTNEEAAIDAPARVAVISDALWQSSFGGDSSIIGKHIPLSSVTFTIIGVTPPGFTGVDLERTDIWIPLGKSPIGMDGVEAMAGQRAQYAGLLARLSPRTSDAALETRATTIIRRANAVDADADSSEHVVSGSIIEARGPGKQQYEVAIAERLGGVAIIVLLIACANVVNLLLARAAARRREIAVRVALGISRVRLAWLLTVPTVILALVAGVAAVASALVTGTVLRSMLVPDVHFADSPIHWRVIVFTLLVSLVAGALSAIVPAIQASRPDVTTFLKGSTQSGTVQRSRLRSMLVAAQAALSVVLLVGAGVFLRSVHNVQSIRLGYDVSRVAFADASFDDWRAPDSVSVARAVDRIHLVPGVEQVAVIGAQPFAGTWVARVFTATDSSHGDFQEWPTLTVATPNYFAATGLRIVRGKGLAADGSWSIVVNETMAREYWPTASAIGQCIRIEKRANRCYTVTGIAEDAHQEMVIEKPRAHFYVPAAHPLGPGMRASEIVIRADPVHWSAVVTATRRILAEAFPGSRPHIERMDDVIAPSYRPFRLGATLFSVFGMLALLVAIVGVYGTVTYSVTQRMHEFGVRIALGAELSDVVRLVVGTGLKAVVVGTVLGVGLALAAGRLIASFLYGVSPSDPVTLGTVVVLLLGVGTAAALAPAWRAARVDPVSALRVE